LCREKNLAGLSPVKQKPASAFFEKLACEAGHFHTWTGELYLERHQGTYTTQARNKRMNRKLELALREAELAAVRALWQAGAAYPLTELLAIWREMLLYQFHDILPGSSITRVYNESQARYTDLMAQTSKIIQTADASLYGSIDTEGMTQPVVVTNSLSWPRGEWVRHDGKWLNVRVPALGYVALDTQKTPEVRTVPRATTSQLENELLRVTFSDDGAISSVYDKVNEREALAAGTTANRLAMYRDLGDAWDFQMHYDEQVPEHFTLQSSAAHVDGPRAWLRQEYRHGQSVLTQDIVLTAGSPRIDFVTHVDWHETDKMLRTSFPTAVFATEATCDIQFGNIRRPARRNTSWDLAQYEICAHKWIDLSERAYGVALLNDCKYGHKVRDNVLDLNLLRSPKHPDPIADRGEHDFTYSLLPHAGDYVQGEVIQRAYELNVPLRVTPVAIHAGSAPAHWSMLQVNAPNIIVEAVKKAEDSDDLIVRLYESTGATTKATVQFGVPVAHVTLVNLMEEDQQGLPLSNGQVTMTFGPYEIHTLCVLKDAKADRPSRM
jgi:alpha-mannosidase